MIEPINVIIGTGIVILNLIPLIMKKPKLLLITVVVSFILILALLFFRGLV